MVVVNSWDSFLVLNGGNVVVVMVVVWSDFLVGDLGHIVMSQWNSRCLLFFRDVGKISVMSVQLIMTVGGDLV